MSNNKKKKTVQRIGGASSPEVIRESKRTHLWAGAFLLFSTFIAYAVSLNGTWALDDSFIGQFQNISGALNLRLGYRKIAHLTFQINKLIDPLNPMNYRVLNILIHIFNALLLYRIAFLTLRMPALKAEYGRYASAVALMSAAVFALHPININAVTYIIQRMASMATMFVLLALLCYIAARTSDSVAKSSGFYAATAVCVTLGIFSKENGVLAVPLILLYDLFFLQKSFKKSSVQAGIGIAAVLIVLGVSSFFLDFKQALISIGNVLSGMNRPITALNWASIDVYWTPLQHILTEFRVIARYIFLILVPLPRFFVFDWWGFPVSTGILHPLSTLTSFLMIAFILSFAVYKRKELPFLSFGILWYFIALSLESFIAIGSDLYFEHRNYLSVAGLFFGVSAQLMTGGVLRDRILRSKSLWTAVATLSLLLGLLTVQRNLAWKDSVTLWTDTVQKTQKNLRAMVALGNAYLKMSDVATAKQYYRKVMNIGLADRRAQFFQDSAYSFAMICLFTDDLEDAKKTIALLDAQMEVPLKMNILKGFYSSLTGDIEEAIKIYKLTLPKTTGLDRVIVYTLLGDTYRKIEQPDEALRYYKKAVKEDPSFAAAYYGMGDAYLIKRDLARATYCIDMTLKIVPNHVLALADMAEILLMEKASIEKARLFAEKAVSLAPVFYQPYLTMGNVLLVSGSDGAAEEFFKKAEAKGAKKYMIPFSKARAYFLRGDEEKMMASLREVLLMKDAPENLRKMIAGNLEKR
jgi:tetratricopeptide (TPR) repeat protein